MDKNISLSISLFLVAVVIATVTSFGGDGNAMGDFGGGDYFNRKYQVVRRVLGISALTVRDTLHLAALFALHVFFLSRPGCCSILYNLH